MHAANDLESLAGDILFEDNHLLAVNKHAGDIVQGDKTGDIPLSDMVKSYIKTRYHKPGEVFLGVVHRLDRPVSGMVLFARTSKALARMNELMRLRSVIKTYWAITANPPPQAAGRLEHYLYKDQEKNKSTTTSAYDPAGKQAELDYKLVGKTDRYYLLEISLITGRHHQIRAQLAAIGCPIKGDLKYGARRSNPDASIHLHARRMQFQHPVRGEWISLTAHPPDDPLWKAFLMITNQETEASHDEH